MPPSYILYPGFWMRFQTAAKEAANFKLYIYGPLVRLLSCIYYSSINCANTLQILQFLHKFYLYVKVLINVYLQSKKRDLSASSLCTERSLRLKC